MSGLHYFMRGGVGPETWRRLGLAHAWGPTLGIRPVARAEAPDGAGDGTGFTAFESPTDSPTMTWRGPYAGGDGLAFWIGWPEHEPRPGPAELWNGTRLHDPERSASPILLRDGRAWSVPIILTADGREGGLPRMFAGGVRDGSAAPDAAVAQARTVVDPRYGELLAAAERMLERWTAGEVVASEASLEYAAALLGVCYRVRLPELLALEVLTPDNVRCIALDSIDAAARVLNEMPEPVRIAVGRPTWTKLEI